MRTMSYVAFRPALSLLVLTLLLLCSSECADAATAPRVSVRDIHGDYNLNFTFTAALDTALGSNTPSSADRTSRTLVLRVTANLTRYSPDVRSVTLAVTTRNFSLEQRAALDRAGGFLLNNLSRLENATTLSLRHVLLDAAPGAGLERSSFGTSVTATFILSVLSPDASERDIISPFLSDSSRYAPLTLFLTGVAAASNVSGVGITFQFQKMRLEQIINSAAGDFYRHRALCAARNVAQSSFLMTLIKSGEEAFVTNGSSVSVLAGLNRQRVYWLGGITFDYRAASRQMCWTDDLMYNAVHASSSAPGLSDLRCTPNSTASAASANGTLFSYASTSSLSASDPFLYCARPPSLGCGKNSTNASALQMPLMLGGDVVALPPPVPPSDYALALQHDGAEWRVAAVKATNATGFSVCARLTRIAAPNVLTGGDTLIYWSRNTSIVNLALVPPRSLSATCSLSNSTEQTASRKLTPSNTQLATDSPSSSYSNFSASLSPEDDKSLTFSNSLVPTPTLTHMLTETVSGSVSPSPDGTRATFSSSESRSVLITESVSVSLSQETGSHSLPASDTLTLETTQTVPTQSLSEPTISISYSLPPPTPQLELVNTSSAPSSASSSSDLKPWQIPFDSVGPAFIGGRDAASDNGAAKTLLASERPEHLRRLVWRVRSPAHLHLNISGGRDCFLEELLDPSWHGSPTPDELASATFAPSTVAAPVSAPGGSSSSTTTATTTTTTTVSLLLSAEDIRRRRLLATRWLFQRSRVKIESIREMSVLLPLIPTWSDARMLFGGDAGMDMLALNNNYEPVKVQGRVSFGCFVGAITPMPAPAVEFAVMPPAMHLAPALTAAETSITVVRSLALVLAPFVFAPHAAPMMIARSGYAFYLVQCTAVPTHGPTIIEYPFRFAVGASAADGAASAEGSGTSNTSDSLAVYMGAILGNLLLLMIVVASGVFVAQLGAIHRGITTREAKAKLRFPSCWIVVPMFLFVDVILRGASFVLFSGNGAVERGIGLIVSLGMLLAFAAGYKALMMRVLPSAKFELVAHRYVSASAATRRLVHFAFGTHRWRNRTKTELSELTVEEGGVDPSSFSEDKDDHDRTTAATNVGGESGDLNLDDAGDAAATRKKKQKRRTKMIRRKKMVAKERRADESQEESERSLLFDAEKVSSVATGDDEDTTGSEAAAAAAAATATAEYEEVEVDMSDSDDSDEEILTLAEMQKAERLKREALVESRTPLVPGFTHRNSRFFRTYNAKNRAFLAVEIVLVAVCGFLSAMRASLRMCSVSSILFVAVISAYLAVLLWRRPWVSPLEFWFALLLTVAQLASGILLCYGFFVASYESSLLAAQLSMLMQIVTSVKLLLDVALRVWLWRVRKARLEHEAFVKHERKMREAGAALLCKPRQTLLNIGEWYDEDGLLQQQEESNDVVASCTQQEQNDGQTTKTVTVGGGATAEGGASSSETTNTVTLAPAPLRQRKHGESFVLIPIDDEKVEVTAANKAERDGFIEKGPTAEWQPDSAADTCNRCNELFTLTRRRSHCRAVGCLLLFCSACVPHRVSMYDPRECAIVKNQKCCDACFKDKDKYVGKSKIDAERERAEAADAVASTATEQSSVLDGGCVGEDGTFIPRAIAPEFWDKDEDYPMCSRCDVEFDMTTRRHHCRRCAKTLCLACCNNFISMLSPSGVEILQNQRCCQRCLPRKKKQKLVAGSPSNNDSLLIAGLAPFADDATEMSSMQEQNSLSRNNSGIKQQQLLQPQKGASPSGSKNKLSAIEAALDQSIWTKVEEATMTAAAAAAAAAAELPSNDNNSLTFSSFDNMSFATSNNSFAANGSMVANGRMLSSSKKKPAAAPLVVGNPKRAQAVADRVLATGSSWLASTRAVMGRGFDREEAVLREEWQRDSGAGRGKLLSHLAMSPSAKKRFDVPTDSDGECGEERAADEEEEQDGARRKSLSQSLTRATSAARDGGGGEQEESEKERMGWMDDFLPPVLNKTAAPVPAAAAATSSRVASASPNLYPTSFADLLPADSNENNDKEFEDIWAFAGAPSKQKRNEQQASSRVNDGVSASSASAASGGSRPQSPNRCDEQHNDNKNDDDEYDLPPVAVVVTGGSGVKDLTEGRVAHQSFAITGEALQDEWHLLL